MRKKIMVKEPLELEIEFNNRVFVLVFNTRALLNLASIEEELMGLLSEFNIAEACSRVIWASANPCIDILEARQLTANLDTETITEIMQSFNESVGTVNTDVKKVQEEMQKKLMSQFLDSMRSKK